MGLLRSSLKENNEAALPMFTESSFHVGTGNYSRLCALSPAWWAPLLFPRGWKRLLKAGKLWVTSKMKCSIFSNPVLTFFKKIKCHLETEKNLTDGLAVGRVGKRLSRRIR